MEKSNTATISKSPQHLDRERLLEECDEDSAFACRCLHIYVREAQVDMNGIAAALEKYDFPLVARLAHRIKGASASIRADFLREEAARLETLGYKAELAAAAESFARLRSEFDHFKTFIATLKMLPD
jgi:HPt (histidine-containing phosphotransfer) domain-containing protein